MGSYCRRVIHTFRQVTTADSLLATGQKLDSCFLKRFSSLSGITDDSEESNRSAFTRSQVASRLQDLVAEYKSARQSGADESSTAPQSDGRDNEAVQSHSKHELAERLAGVLQRSVSDRLRDGQQGVEQPSDDQEPEATPSPPLQHPKPHLRKENKVKSPLQEAVHNLAPARAPTEATKELRAAVFEDIGVSQQAAWYELATGDPLVHGKHGTHICIHSVNAFHASSIECSRSMLQLLRPAVLAVGIPNNMHMGIYQAAQTRLASVRDSEHVKKIADGYHRICMDVRDPSPLNATVDELEQSYHHGREIARLHNMHDFHSILEELEGQEEQMHEFLKWAEDPVMMRSMWHAMFLSGMLPLEHWDRIIVEASSQGRAIACVEMSESKQEQLAQCGPSISPNV